MDYQNLKKIVIHTQQELDDVPADYKGRIYIKCTTTVKVDKHYYWAVVAWDNSSVEAWDNSSVEAWGNSSVEAWENSSVVAWDNSSVVAWDNSSVVARGNSSVVARENSSVEAWENSSVVARENSSVEAWGNSQVLNKQINGKIIINGNARTVFMPQNIHDFMDFYGIKHTKTKAIFYKAVHKNSDTYSSNHNRNFVYEIGEIQISDCDPNPKKNCGTGIHIAHLTWALEFGKVWNDLAILEVETNIDDIVMPDNTDGKVRTSKIKVLREVPLEECGLYGKILAKRRIK